MAHPHHILDDSGGFVTPLPMAAYPSKPRPGRLGFRWPGAGMLRLAAALYGKLLLKSLSWRNRAQVRDLRPLALHLEQEVFPQLDRTEVTRFTVYVGGKEAGLRGRGGEHSLTFQDTEALVKAFRRLGLSRIRLDTHLDARQMVDAILVLFWVGRAVIGAEPRDRPYAGWRCSRVAEAMRGAVGYRLGDIRLRFDLAKRTYRVSHTAWEFEGTPSAKPETPVRRTARRAVPRGRFIPLVAVGLFAGAAALLPLVVWSGVPVSVVYLAAAAAVSGGTAVYLYTAGALTRTRQRHEQLMRDYLRQIRDLSRLSEANPNPVMKLDARGNAIVVNPAAKRLLRQMEARDNPYAILPKNAPALAAKCLEEGEAPAQAEAQCAGRVFIYTFSRIRGEEGVLVSGKDITAIKRVERELRRLNDDIEQQNEKLRQANAFTAKLLKVASHDLRNPLSLILCLADESSSFVKRHDPPEGLRNVFRQVNAAAGQMQSIIEDFLDFQAVKEGKLRPVPASIAVDEAIDAAIARHRFAAERKDIALAREGGEGLAAWADRRHLAHALDNYLSNAVKYSPSGTDVMLYAFPTAGGVRIEVCDDGPGVPAAERGQLFVEFARITTEPTGEEASTGLGLSIVKHLVEAQGGRVGADFPESGGSQFWMELPCPAP